MDDFYDELAIFRRVFSKLFLMVCFQWFLFWISFKLCFVLFKIVRAVLRITIRCVKFCVGAIRRKPQPVDEPANEPEPTPTEWEEFHRFEHIILNPMDYDFTAKTEITKPNEFMDSVNIAVDKDRQKSLAIKTKVKRLNKILNDFRSKVIENKLQQARKPLSPARGVFEFIQLETENRDLKSNLELSTDTLKSKLIVIDQLNVENCNLKKRYQQSTLKKDELILKLATARGTASMWEGDCQRVQSKLETYVSTTESLIQKIKKENSMLRAKSLKCITSERQLHQHIPKLKAVSRPQDEPLLKTSELFRLKEENEVLKQNLEAVNDTLAEKLSSIDKYEQYLAPRILELEKEKEEFLAQIEAFKNQRSRKGIMKEITENDQAAAISDVRAESRNKS